MPLGPSSATPYVQPEPAIALKAVDIIIGSCSGLPGALGATWDDRLFLHSLLISSKLDLPNTPDFFRVVVLPAVTSHNQRVCGLLEATGKQELDGNLSGVVARTCGF